MSTLDVSDEAGTGSNRKQVHFELWHPGCWTLDVTEALDGTKIVVNSAHRTDTTLNVDVILITKDDRTEMDEFLDTIDSHDAVNSITLLKWTARRARAIVNYDRETSISPKIINSEFVPLEPVRVTGGYEYWTVLVKSDQLGSKIQEMQDECDIEIKSIQEFDPKANIEFADIIDRIHNHLTPRQSECLLTALDEGYYNWPRKKSADDVAEELPISGPTFLEHLRKGEQKVITTILEEVAKRDQFIPSRRLV